MIRPLYLDDATGDLRAGGGSGGAQVDVLQWWQTHTLHAQGVGQQDMPIVVPYHLTVTGIRYRIHTAGSGGTIAAELRVGDPLTPLAGTAATPAVSPAWTAASIDLDADTLLWAYFTSVNSTPGAQMKAELRVVRR